MKEVQSLLKLVSDGLKTLAQGVEALADKVDEAAKAKSKRQATVDSSAAPARKPPAAEKPSVPAMKKAPAKKPAAKVSQGKAGAKPVTAIDTVMGLIAGSSKGVSTAEIKSKTGYDQKKVANIIYKLKKQNRIKSVNKGVYVKF